MEPEALLKKLLTRKAEKHWIIRAPDQLQAVFNSLNGSPADSYDFILLFSYSLDELEQSLSTVLDKWEPDTLLWLAYPKGSSPLKSDLNRKTLVETVATYRIRPVTQIAINSTWTAMRLRPIEKVGK